MDKQERKNIIDRVIRGMKKERYSQDGERAYEIAESNFTPNQMGALHRAMRETERSLYELDADPL